MTDTRRALVVGGSWGVGVRLATRLSENGWAVTATGRRPRSDTGLAGHVDYQQLDLFTETAVKDMTELLRSLRPQLIVHNAATYPTAELDLAECEAIFRVNALVPYQVLAGYLPDADCTCVLVNSDSIYHANRTSGVYAASKAALRVLASALADRCRGSKACVATLLLGPLADDRKAEHFERIAQQQRMLPEEVAKAYLRWANPPKWWTHWSTSTRASAAWSASWTWEPRPTACCAASTAVRPEHWCDRKRCEVGQVQHLA